jgi:hypothetical protein
MGASVTQPTTSSKVFYAHLFDESGVLARINGAITFFNPDTGNIVEIEPSMCNFLTVLDEVGLADAKAIMDQIRGGAAWIATHRAMEVA